LLDLFREVEASRSSIQPIILDTEPEDDMAVPIEVRKSVTILKPREEVFEALRLRPVLGGLIDDLTRVEPYRFRWASRLVDGGRLEGEVEIDELVENEQVSWHAASGSELLHEGSLRLTLAPHGRGTEVAVRVSYDPPAGRVGQLLLRLTGDEPKQVLTRHLYQLRQLLEAGEIATTEGQPSGREEELREDQPAVVESSFGEERRP
jgi:uncharacterized membrane protein